MVGDGFMGELQLPASLNGGLLQQKSRDALIQTFPHDLFDEPHHIGKPRRHQLVGIVRHRRGFLHHALIDFCRDHPELRILFRFDRHIKLDGTQHAGCGKQAHIPVKQSVDGDLPPLLRKDKGAQLPGLYQEQPGAVHAAVVYDGSLFYCPGPDRAKNAVLLYGGQFSPYREIVCKIHGLYLLAEALQIQVEKSAIERIFQPSSFVKIFFFT